MPLMANHIVFPPAYVVVEREGACASVSYSTTGNDPRWCPNCGLDHPDTTGGCVRAQHEPKPTLPQLPSPVANVVPFCCPVCNGAGHVSRPPWVAGDVPMWSDSGTGSYTCNGCKGSGVVWGPR